MNFNPYISYLTNHGCSLDVLRQQIKGQFSTYLSPDMVNMLVKDPSLMKLGGERKEMTFLFTDIMGFTPVSEAFKKNDDPEGLVDLINTYLDSMTKIILENGGTIDKYMGDCIMAFWNAPLPCDNHADMAVKSAIEINAKTEELNKEFKNKGLNLIEEIITIYNNYPDRLSTEVLVASIRSPLQVVQVAQMGADVATIPPNIIKQMIKHPLTDIGLNSFMEDWKKTGQTF